MKSQYYRNNKKRFYILLFTGICFLLIFSFVSLISGNYSTSIKDVISVLLHAKNSAPKVFSIVVYSRLNRLLAAVLVGAALSLAGLVYQEIFNNRMISPDILGVSAGAGVGASIGFLLGFGTQLISVFAFLFALISVTLALFISLLFGRRADKVLSLVLSGIVVSGFMNSIIGLIKCISTNNQLASITYWLMGGLNDISYGELAGVALPIAICIVVLFLFRWKISMIGRGEEDAVSHGVNYKQVQFLAIVSATVLTSCSVSISGTIGWIGLVIPNIMRIAIKDNGKYLLILTAIYGSIFTIISDLLARTLSHSEIPIGIITGILGSICFVLVVIIKQKRKKKIYD